MAAGGHLSFSSFGTFILYWLSHACVLMMREKAKLQLISRRHLRIYKHDQTWACCDFLNRCTIRTQLIQDDTSMYWYYRTTAPVCAPFAWNSIIQLQFTDFGPPTFPILRTFCSPMVLAQEQHLADKSEVERCRWGYKDVWAAVGSFHPVQACWGANQEQGGRVSTEGRGREYQRHPVGILGEAAVEWQDVPDVQPRPDKFGGGFFRFLHGLEIHNVSGNSLGDQFASLSYHLSLDGVATPIQQFRGFILQPKQIWHSYKGVCEHPLISQHGTGKSSICCI
jgi:hypothetical protein